MNESNVVNAPLVAADAVLIAAKAAFDAIGKEGESLPACPKPSASRQEQPWWMMYRVLSWKEEKKNKKRLRGDLMEIKEEEGGRSCAESSEINSAPTR
jgi:hypothetical protein